MNHLRSVSPATTVPTTRNECLSVVCLAIACQSAVIHRKRGEKDGGVCCPFQKLRDTRFFSSWIKNKRPPSSLLFFSAPTRFRKCSAARPPVRQSVFSLFSFLFYMICVLSKLKTERLLHLEIEPSLSLSLPSRVSSINNLTSSSSWSLTLS